MRNRIGATIAALCAGLMPFPVLAAQQCGPAKLVTSIDTVTDPFGRMLVPVKIGGAGRLMLFDSGGVAGGITRPAAEQFHLSVYPAGSKVYGISGTVSSDNTTIPSFELGTLQVANQRFMVFPNDMQEVSGGGVIGALPQFPKLDTDLDFAGQKISFFLPGQCAPNWFAGAKLAVVPMQVTGAHIVVAVTLDGKRLNAVVDTGAAGSVLNLRTAQSRFGIDVAASDVKEVGQLRNNQSAKVYQKQFSTLSFEGVIVSNPVIDLVPDEIARKVGDTPDTGTLIPQPDRGLPEAILGMNVLSKMHMYIAYRERKLYLMAVGDGAPIDAAALSAAGPAAAAIRTGSWKITFAKGPAVNCEIVRAQTELAGSCTTSGLKADLTGVIAGPVVRWQFNGGRDGPVHFSGIMASDETITGFAEQAATRAAFTARKQ